MKRAKGVVTVEFILLFPFIVAMLYAAAIYGITFFAKYQIQDVADRAVASALYVDRSAFPAADVPAAVKARAEAALSNFKDSLPAGWKGRLEGDCSTEIAGGIDVIRCSLTYPDFKENPITPALSFGWLGSFPPLPNNLTGEARAAF
ncbi:TadE/TadG family type IV pilus assembly protein [Alloalcanivorax xenomutans]|uniref:TadE/TadG family type IV pilus assembly protein n=1 Tax=Alloalcanivorax xenomutans TaxID=1094342 RepID=UPI0006D76B77|nr:TadE/TadG family type IV pilus assembly protein [Alloalcanivorax xenomutans]PHS71237.1 MAG: hypothetical protein COB00_03400 [Alcanivorax sp.]|tara:strand:+ start:1590 stop:2030 length:441 start_codon:yes stop_codon:yes gene_type:complete